MTPVNVFLPNKDLLVLPVGEIYQLRAVGGSGLYRYEIDSRELAKISYSGIISTKSEGDYHKVCDPQLHEEPGLLPNSFQTEQGRAAVLDFRQAQEISDGFQ